MHQSDTAPESAPASGLEPAEADLVGPAPLTPRSITLAVSMVATSLLVAVVSVLPMPYAVQGPGPTKDTLGEVDGTPLISIDGVPTYESTGELRLTTVSVSGGPGYPVTLTGIVQGWWERARAVRPVEEIFPPSQTRDEIDARNQAEMVSSQENATVAALEELGYQVPTVLRVSEPIEGSGADGVVQPDDVLVSVDGFEVTSFAELSARMDEVAPPAVVTVGVERDGQRRDLPVTTSDDGTGKALLGVLIDPEFDLPVDVTIEIESIGGSSAGTMFALGIIDKLTEADEANGVVIAGTGTMDLTGVVGPIGGVRQKMVGAARDGATWFLAPEANCEEAVGYEPRGVHVVRVATLSQARAAVEAIGSGTGESLPTCG